MGKDIKIGLGLAIILILFLIVFLISKNSSEIRRESLTEETEAEVIITGAEEPAAEPSQETLFGPGETLADTVTVPADIPSFEAESELVLEGFEEEEIAIAETPPEIAEPVVRIPQKYTVKAGDRLTDIANEFYGDPGKWKLIQKANDNIDPRKLRVGMVLIIPDISAGTAIEGEPPPTPLVTGGKTHTVVDGDSLWKIAQKYYGDGNKHKLIMKANNITDPDKLSTGRVLKIPPAK